MYKHTNITKKLHTLKFSVGQIEDNMANDILDVLEKLDSFAQMIHVHSGSVRNGKRVSRPIFLAIVKMNAERELFFKLKLKYPDFKTEKLLSLYD